jgi:hypothetical protein
MPAVDRGAQKVEVPMVTPRIFALNAVGTTVYLGIAIAARGGFAAFFVQPALVAVALVTVVLAAVGMFSAGNVSPRRA